MLFIDDGWNLQSLPIDFIPSTGKHSGKEIATLVLEVIDELEIKSKIRGITLDNAAANTTFMRELTALLHQENIAFDSEDFRRFAHILNLGVQDTMAGLNSSNTDTESFDDEEFHNDELQELNRDNIVTKIRKLFLKLKMSEQWDNKLRACCAAVNVKKLSTCIDVSIWWNSTFQCSKRQLR